MIAALKAMHEGTRIAPERSCAEWVNALAAINADIRVASDPVTATARGALIAARYEK